VIEYLIRLLDEKYRVAVLSRGYGRKSKGFRWVETTSQVSEVGDEPMQIKLKFPQTLVAVRESRVEGISEIMSNFPQTEIILLDDAYQHRAITPYLNLLLCNSRRPYFDDAVLPVGRLREWSSAEKRADAVIVTKCSDDLNRNKFENRIAVRPLFFSSIEYNDPNGTEVYGFCGLANGDAFREHLQNNYNLKGFRSFRDHYRYKKSDIEKLQIKAEGARLVCTEKDWVKCRELGLDLDFIPISFRMREEEAFKAWLMEKLEKFES
jgi:tetraacyldisaccharide 4'-kinase